MATMKAVKHVELKFSIDPEYLESALDLVVINCRSYDALKNDQVGSHFEGIATESKILITLHKFGEIITKELRMDRNDNNARTRIQTLFTNYNKFLSPHGVRWLINENRNWLRKTYWIVSNRGI